MNLYKNNNHIRLRGTSVFLVCAIIVSNAAFALPQADNSTLAPPSRFNPIVSIEQQDGKYVVVEDKAEKANLQEELKKDVAFFCLNHLIAQALQLGLKKGVARKLIEKYFRETFSSEEIRTLKSCFKWNSLYKGNNAFHLPYVNEKSGRRLILHYFLPDKKIKADTRIPTQYGDVWLVVENMEEPESDDGQSLIIKRNKLDLREIIGEAAEGLRRREEFGKRKIEVSGETAVMRWPRPVVLDVVHTALETVLKNTNDEDNVRVFVRKGEDEVLVRIYCASEDVSEHDLKQDIEKSGLKDMLDDMYGWIYPEVFRDEHASSPAEAVLTITLPVDDPKVLIRSGARHGMKVPNEYLPARVQKFFSILKRNGLEDEYMVFGGHIRNLFAGRKGIGADLDVVAKIDASEKDLLRTRCEVLARLYKGELSDVNREVLGKADQEYLQEAGDRFEERFLNMTKEDPFYPRVKQAYEEHYGDREEFKNTRTQIRDAIRYLVHVEIIRRYVLPVTTRLERIMGVEEGAISDYVIQDGRLIHMEDREKIHEFEGTVIDYTGFATTDGVFHHARARFTMFTSNSPRLDQVGVWGNRTIYDPLDALDDYRQGIIKLEFPLASDASVQIRQVLRCFRIKHLAFCEPDNEAVRAMYGYYPYTSIHFPSTFYWRRLVEKHAVLDEGLAELEELVIERERLLNEEDDEQLENIRFEIDTEIGGLLRYIKLDSDEWEKAERFLREDFPKQTILIRNLKGMGHSTEKQEKDLKLKKEEHLYIPSKAGALSSGVTFYEYVKDVKRDPHFVAWFVAKIYRAALRPQDVRRDLERAGLMPVMQALAVNIDVMEEEAVDIRLQSLESNVGLEEGIELAEYMLDQGRDKEKWLSALHGFYRKRAAYDREEGRPIAARSNLCKAAECAIALAESVEEGKPFSSARRRLTAARIYEEVNDLKRARELYWAVSRFLQHETSKIDAGMDYEYAYSVWELLTETFERLSALEAKAGDVLLCKEYHHSAQVCSEALKILDGLNIQREGNPAPEGNPGNPGNKEDPGISREARNLLEKGEVTITADDGREFIFRLSVEEVQDRDLRDLREQWRLEVFVKQEGEERKISYAHARFYENPEFGKRVEMDYAFEKGKDTYLSGNQAILVAEDYRNNYSGIGRTVMSSLMQIAYLKQAEDFHLYDVKEGSIGFYLDLGFRPMSSAVKKLKFPLSREKAKDGRLMFPDIGIGKAEIPDPFSEILPEEAEACIATKRYAGVSWVPVWDQYGSLTMLMPFDVFEKLALERVCIMPVRRGRRIEWHVAVNRNGLILYTAVHLQNRILNTLAVKSQRLSDLSREAVGEMLLEHKGSFPELREGEWQRTKDLAMELLYSSVRQEQASEKDELLINMDKERKIAQDLCITMGMQAFEAKKLEENIIIGLDESWIPDMRGRQGSALQPLLRDIGRLAKNSNIIFIRDKGEELAARLLKTAEDTGTHLSNIVVLGSFAAIESNAFNELRSTVTEDKAFLVSVNPEYLTEDSYIRIVEMLAAAIKLAFGEIYSVDIPGIEAISAGPRTWIFVPGASPVEFEELKKIYENQQQTISAA